ncbi:hypothetical protein [Paenibacillus glycanilyticus]|uniref:hypothetical protein n=1 Tax=Paenibacillus glycanilyticus TaxID=126569 RepID=UPI000FD7CD68|nr:hypothetical protein [Paenibacillus glycanilyticus]
MSKRPNPNKNDVVIIELDRPRELRFGHKAIKRIAAATGKSMEEMEGGNISFDDIELYLYYGLLSDARQHNEELKLEDMEDLLDEAPTYSHIIEKLQEAFVVSFGGLAEGNAPAGK